MMLSFATCLTVILGVEFAICEGKQCHLTSCLHNCNMKWVLPEDNEQCTQITLGGHSSRCPVDDIGLVLANPYLLSAEDELRKILTPTTTQNPKTKTCPPDMIFGNCTGMATCEDPTGQNGGYFNTCSDATACTCPRDLLMKGGHCVPHNECGCFLSDSLKVISVDDFYVNGNCSRRCECRDNELFCENDYRCSHYAVCEERNNVHQCYCTDGSVGDGQNCTLMTSCIDIYDSGFSESGIYSIMPTTLIGSPFKVYCNMENGGGWTVFQRRVNGSVDFYRDWEYYKQGFGFLDHEFWLGNDKITSLTSQADYELRIDLVNSLGLPFYATYDLFRIANEDDNYRLTHLGMFSGTAGCDAMDTQRGNAFSTPDRDNDVHIGKHCAQLRHGAWWYKSCTNSNLNGGYFENDRNSIWWKNLTGSEHNIKYTEMKIRPIRK